MLKIYKLWNKVDLYFLESNIPDVYFSIAGGLGLADIKVVKGEQLRYIGFGIAKLIEMVKNKNIHTTMEHLKKIKFSFSGTNYESTEWAFVSGIDEFSRNFTEIFRTLFEHKIKQKDIEDAVIIRVNELLKSSENDPVYPGIQASREIMYPLHPFNMKDIMGSLEKDSKKENLDLLANSLLIPENASVFITGNIDCDEFVAKFSENPAVLKLIEHSGKDASRIIIKDLSKEKNGDVVSLRCLKRGNLENKAFWGLKMNPVFNGAPELKYAFLTMAEKVYESFQEVETAVSDFGRTFVNIIIKTDNTEKSALRELSQRLLNVKEENFNQIKKEVVEDFKNMSEAPTSLSIMFHYFAFKDVNMFKIQNAMINIDHAGFIELATEFLNNSGEFLVTFDVEGENK